MTKYIWKSSFWNTITFPGACKSTYNWDLDAARDQRFSKTEMTTQAVQMKFYGGQNVTCYENPHKNERISVILCSTCSLIACAKYGCSGDWLIPWSGVCCFYNKSFSFHFITKTVYIKNKLRCQCVISQLVENFNIVDKGINENPNL